jgi:hypothetical protein
MNNISKSNLIPTVSDVTFGYMAPSSSDDPFGPLPAGPQPPRGVGSWEGGMRLKPKRIEP